MSDADGRELAGSGVAKAVGVTCVSDDLRYGSNLVIKLKPERYTTSS